MSKLTLNEWAKKHNVSTLYDYDKFENREFLKRLDETKSMYPKKETVKESLTVQKEGVFEKLRYLFIWEKNLQYDSQNKSWPI
jgi:hypothetical protein